MWVRQLCDVTPKSALIFRIKNAISGVNGFIFGTWKECEQLLKQNRADQSEIHEIISDSAESIKVFLDVEYYSEGGVNEAKLMSLLATIHKCCCIFQTVAEGAFSVSKSDVLVACASRFSQEKGKWKNSFHIVIRRFGVRTMEEVKAFAEFVKNNALEPVQKIIDFAVYRKNANFRVVDTLKDKNEESRLVSWQDAPFADWLVTSPTSKTIVLNDYIRLELKYQFAEQLPESGAMWDVSLTVFIEVLIDSVSFELGRVLRNLRPRGTEMDRYIPLVRKMGVKEVYCPVCDRDHGSDNQYLSLSQESLDIWIVYYKCFRGDLNAVFLGRFDFKQNPPKYIESVKLVDLHINEFEKFTQSEKVTKQDINKLQNTIPNFEIAHLNDANVMTYMRSNWRPDCINYLVSEPGTGKTEFYLDFIKTHPDLSCLIIVPLRTLGLQILDPLVSLGFKSHLVSADRQSFSQGSHIVCVVNSLHCVRTKKFDIVIVDECFAITGQVRTMGTNVHENVGKLVYYTNHATFALLLDAHFDYPLVSGFSEIFRRTKKTEILHINEYCLGVGQTWYMHLHDIQFFGELKRCVLQDETLFVVCTTKTLTKGITEFIKEFLPKHRQIIEVVGDTPLEEKRWAINNFSHLVENKFIYVVNTAISVGISTLKEMKNVFCVSNNADVSVVTSFQQCKRPRKCTTFHCLLGKIPPRYNIKTKAGLLKSLAQSAEIADEFIKTMPFNIGFETMNRIFVQCDALSLLLAQMLVKNKYSDEPDMNFLRLIAATGASIKLYDKTWDYAVPLPTVQALMSKSKHKLRVAIIQNAKEVFGGGRSYKELLVEIDMNQRQRGEAARDIVDAVAVFELANFYGVCHLNIDDTFLKSYESRALKAKFVKLLKLAQHRTWAKLHVYLAERQRNMNMDLIQFVDAAISKHTNVTHHAIVFDVLRHVGVGNPFLRNGDKFQIIAK